MVHYVHYCGKLLSFFLMLSSKVSLSFVSQGRQAAPCGSSTDEAHLQPSQGKDAPKFYPMFPFLFPLLSCILVVVPPKCSGCNRNHLSILGYSASCGMVLKVWSIMICGEESAGLKLNGTAI
jgi:hypothetical protein